MAIVQLQSVTKRYGHGAGERTVLADVNLSVNAGSFTGLIGPSGSGKSTVLNLCGLVDQPTEGKILWQGLELNYRNQQTCSQLRRSEIGFIFQQFNLVPVMTVRDNIGIALTLLGGSVKENQRAVDEILDQVGLTEHANKKPTELSGGQCQRVAIARALVKRPKLVIADEPTANLDADTALIVTELLQTLAQKRHSAVLLATHDPRLSQWCDELHQVEHSHISDFQKAQEEVLA